ncbi:hypothetical protein KGQ19_11215 [Catenulispora sp. NL8]|uniref:Integron gene cassette protein n=1 Tax=Catenulispora pinistramenti TaxID=2705254 RepID=A0ABS5KN07_9ACTN|nr:hypothetical protein [Catenulispora pinistramenti]MBS2547441.1 hypothetical protein [Catenulispora pinistramenti]
MPEINNWLKRDNLKGFLVALSSLAEYRFDNSDWDAIETGLESDSGDPSWFRYPLVGQAKIEIAISKQVEEGDVDVRVSIEGASPCLGEQVRAVWMVFNRFEVAADVDLLD